MEDNIAKQEVVMELNAKSALLVIQKDISQ
jgi:hypothetical protein